MYLRLIRLFTSFLLLGLLTVSCSGDDKDNEPPVPPTRTVIVYIAGENSLTDQMLNDVNEIKSGACQMKDGERIVLFYDNKGLSTITVLDNKSTLGTKATYTFESNQDACDPLTLRKVLNWAAEHCPAPEYGLVFGSHASSWLPSTDITPQRAVTASSGGMQFSFGIDNGQGNANDTGSQMEISDMAAALEASNLHFKYIFFDACVMQSIECLYDLRNTAEYIIGSPASTPGDGAYYTHQISSGLFSDDPSDIARTFMSDVRNKMSPTYIQGAVISVVKTEYLDELARTTREMLLKNIDQLPKPYPNMNGVQHYLEFRSKLYFQPDYFDAGIGIHRILPEEDAIVWENLLNKAIVYKDGTSSFYGYTFSNNGFLTLSPTFSGVSMFVPQLKYYVYSTGQLAIYGNHNENFKKTSWYKAAGWGEAGY